MGALALWAPHQPASFLLSASRSRPRATSTASASGLLQAGWTYTGYDASAHVTEETVDPARNAPWGTFLSVIVSGVAGYVLLLVVTLSVGDLDAAVASDNAFLFVLTHALPETMARALVWMTIGAMWFCGLASVTSCSRMLFAFARDGGLPMSPRIAAVSPRWKTPHVAVWITIAFAFVLAATATAYSAIVALSTIALYASYGLPILAGLRARSAGVWTKRGPWHLGRFSTAVNVVALGWVAITGWCSSCCRPMSSRERCSRRASSSSPVYWYAVHALAFQGPAVAREIGGIAGRNRARSSRRSSSTFPRRPI